MNKQAAFFRGGGIFGKEGPYTCYIMADFLLWTVIRYKTTWDDGDFVTWRTRIKLKWNVVDRDINAKQ